MRRVWWVVSDFVAAVFLWRCRSRWYRLDDEGSECSLCLDFPDSLRESMAKVHDELKTNGWTRLT